MRLLSPGSFVNHGVKLSKVGCRSGLPFRICLLPSVKSRASVMLSSMMAFIIKGLHLSRQDLA